MSSQTRASGGGGGGRHSKKFNNSAGDTAANNNNKKSDHVKIDKEKSKVSFCIQTFAYSDRYTLPLVLSTTFHIQFNSHQVTASGLC